MNSREKIIAYMKAKRLALFKLTGMNLYNRADYNEIRKLDDNKCEKIWESISLKLRFAVNLCPQCALTDFECYKCNYGKRHGICGQGGDWSTMAIGLQAETLFEICCPIIDKLNKE